MHYSSQFLKLSNEILTQGRRRLKTSMGIVSHIEDQRYEIVVVESDANVFVAGESFLLNDTYCREIVSGGQTLAITEMQGIRGMQHHPLYDSMALEVYIATPIYFHDLIWGTLNFSSMEIRDKNFSVGDIAWIKESANRLSEMLKRGDSG